MSLLVVLVLVAVVVVRALMVGRVPQTVSEPVSLPSIDREAAVERLGQSLRIPTVSLDPDAADSGDPEPFTELHQLLATNYPRVHAELERRVVSEYSLLFFWPGTDSTLRPLLLLAHMDVVPVEAPEAWTHPPFSGRRADGFVWGRGALDDKLGVVGILEAVEALLGEGYRPRRGLYIAFGHDEEVGGRAGAVALAEHLERAGVRPWMILDEGGAVVDGMLPGIDRSVAVVGVAEKGYASLELTARGEGGHSNMPGPTSAIGRLSRAIVALEDEPMPASLSGPTEMMMDRLAPHVGFGMKTVLANRWLFGPVMTWVMSKEPPANATIRTTTAPTMLDAGVKDNVLASRARAVVNFRLVPGDTVQDVIAHVETTIDDAEIEVACRTKCWDPTPVSSIEHPGFERIEASIGQVFEHAVVAPYLVIGATDARHYAHLCEAVYRFLPVRMSNEDRARMHGADERVSEEGVEDAIAFYASLIVRSTGQD